MAAASSPPQTSFVPVSAECDFPLQNLPYGVFCPQNQSTPRVGVAIGDLVLDLSVLEGVGLISVPGAIEPVFSHSSLNALMAFGRPAWTAVRARLTELLRSDVPTLREDAQLCELAFHAQSACRMVMPVQIGDYTDFYSSRDHATNVGTMIRGAENALQENWLHLPVAYHGRASSVVVSETNIRRPRGQTGPGKFGPSKALDFELEAGFFLGPGSELGNPIPIQDAADHIFGLVLVNDWSARDLQKWEYVPLGPFLAKNFATSISPWVVTMDALAPFRKPGPAQDPTPLPYLQTTSPWTLDVELEVTLTPAGTETPVTISHSNMKHLYWNMAQQLAHHTISGCNTRPGDLLASGTISGPDRAARGSMLELSWGGKEPLELPHGARRAFLEDGDRVTLSAWCAGKDYRIGFGSVTGEILPAL